MYVPEVWGDWRVRECDCVIENEKGVEETSRIENNSDLKDNMVCVVKCLFYFLELWK